MMPKTLVILALAAICAGATPAAAQSGSSQPSTAPGPTVPPAVPDMRPGETLSDQMERHNGVIPPKGNVDPDMHVPAPDTGTMPVIPPPGAKDGVQPK